MDPLSKLGRALAVVRRTSRPAAPKGSDAAPSAAGRQQASDLDFRAQLAQRLRAIERQDPNFRTASTRVFLEQVLLREFGDEMLSTHDFQEMVREVQRVMESDAAMRMDLDELIRRLVDRDPP